MTMILPRALVIGPMKAGTTWIQYYLEARGDVCLPGGVKETFFFDRNYAKGTEWYAAHFADCAVGQALVMEVAPSLFHHPQAPSRVAETLGPNLSIIATLRDPVERSWSHYQHLRRYGYTQLPLDQAVARFPQILDASRYDAQLARWRKTLPDARFERLPLEMLRRDPASYAAGLCAALGLSPKDPADLVVEPANEAAIAPSFRLAAAGRKLSYWLRDRQLYGVVNAAKRLGLKRFVFGMAGQGKTPQGPEPWELDFLRTRLEEQSEALG